MFKRFFIECLLCLCFAALSANEIRLASPEKCGVGCTKLTWTQCGSGEVRYVIFRHIGNGPWQAIDTVRSSASFPDYEDAIYSCEEIVSYRIFALDGSCASSDSVARPFKDSEGPASVSINALSVNPQTNQIEIFWTPSLSYYTHGYRIFEGPLAIQIDAVSGANISSYTAQRSADTNSLFYIAAVDLCGNIRSRSPARQAFISRAEQRTCKKELEISWSDARRSLNETLEIFRFEIILSKNDGVYFRADTVEASQRSAVVDISGATHLDKYKIFVRAVSSDTNIYANSIADSVIVISAPIPTFVNVETINVIDNNTVEMRCSVDVSVVWENLFAYVDDSLARVITYEDYIKNNNILLPRKHTFYHFEISDTCGKNVANSNDARPVFLRANLHETLVELTFSAYQGWEEKDWRYYHIFEIRNGDTVLKSRQSFASDSVFTHQILVENLESVVSLAYYVVANKDEGISNVTAKSNVVELISSLGVTVNFPTGFIPESKITPTYKPLYTSLPQDKLKFQIYNKFGQTVFSTDKPNDGWDGTFNNNGRTECEPGVYMYQFILMRNEHTTRKSGWVVLIRK
ncbi:MAG: gliding motility-associated C-terminal domain-containing protein [Bacteroidales bacterium]|jgi:hypothetical protein|nr:gliding motility-associated C-terminal domain-containing protein [Bacteroidales bacterium]